MIDRVIGSAGWNFNRGTLSEGPLKPTEEYELWADPVGFLSISRVGDGQPSTYRMRFSDELVLDVFPDKRMIEERAASPGLSESTRDHILADQVLPRILSHDGTLVLHAGAIRYNDASVLFVGESGYGKSSLTASFDDSGYPIMGDDALVISRNGAAYCAAAVYPSLRLFPDSIEALVPKNATTRTVAHYTSKRRVDVGLSQDTGRAGPLPIEGIFLLGGPDQGDDIRVRPMKPANACIALLRNSFALDPSDTQMARKRLGEASALSDEVPAYEICYPHDYGRLPKVREAVIAALANRTRQQN